LRSVKTLRQHFRKELALGEIDAVATVAQTHFQMAKSGNHPRSTIHSLEKRQRWQDLQGSESRPAAIPTLIVEI
jgi:hypothetical protein